MCEKQADSTRYRQLGNAVAVPVLEWIGKQIIRVMEADCTTRKSGKLITR